MNSVAPALPDVRGTFEAAFNHHTAGNLEVAEKLYIDLLRERPDHPDSLRNLGAIALVHGEPDKAIALLTRAISVNPNDAQAYNNLGVAYTNKRLDGRAFACFRHATAIDSEFAQAWNNVGTSLRRNKEPREAEWAFRRAIVLNRDYVEALINLGNLLRERGEKREAETLLQRAVELSRNNVAANCVLFELRGADSKDTELGRLLRLRQERLTGTNAVLLEATLGRAYEKAGEYDKAFACFRSSNELKKKQPSVAEPVEEQLRSLAELESLTRSYFEARTGWGIDSATPVFVVGMPRSGTTLCEQIIATHPDALGVGELLQIEEFNRSVMRACIKSGKPDSFEQLVEHVNQDHIARLAQCYLDTLQRHAHPLCPTRIVDKNPFNFRYLWLIALMFPNATVIHCRRDPRDSCLSSYCRLQATFLNDLEELGRYYIAYESLMRHWENVLPLRVLEMQYEELVYDSSTQIRRMIEFCGLSWDERCLRFHEGRQSIQTPSADQVRKDIYTSSVGKWRDYETHLEPLLKCLEDGQGRRHG